MVVAYLGTGVVDLSNAMQRRRVVNALKNTLNMSLTAKLQQSLQIAQSRAINHIFRQMLDPEYEAKRRGQLEIRRKKRAEQREAKEEELRQARMDYSKRKMAISKSTIQ